jgi:transposase
VEAPMLDAEETSEKSCEEKIAKAQAVCLSLAELCGDVPDRDFEERMELLAALVEFWRNGDKVTIERAGDDAEVVKIDHDYAVDVTPNETERLTIEFVS